MDDIFRALLAILSKCGALSTCCRNTAEFWLAPCSIPNPISVLLFRHVAMHRCSPSLTRRSPSDLVPRGERWALLCYFQMLLHCLCTASGAAVALWLHRNCAARFRLLPLFAKFAVSPAWKLPVSATIHQPILILPSDALFDFWRASMLSHLSLAPGLTIFFLPRFYLWSLITAAVFLTYFSPSVIWLSSWWELKRVHIAIST